MENMWWRSSSTAMGLMTTTISVMHCHKLKIHGWLIGGSVGYLLPFWSSHRLMHFLFYDTLSIVGYFCREFLCYCSFFGSLCGNLLTIYTFGNGRGRVRSFRNPFIGWLLHQVTREDIIIGGGFSLQKLPINSTAADLNAEKR